MPDIAILQAQGTRQPATKRRLPHSKSSQRKVTPRFFRSRPCRESRRAIRAIERISITAPLKKLHVANSYFFPVQRYHSDAPVGAPKEDRRTRIRSRAR